MCIMGFRPFNHLHRPFGPSHQVSRLGPGICLGFVLSPYFLFSVCAVDTDDSGFPNNTVHVVMLGKLNRFGSRLIVLGRERMDF